MQPDLLHQLKDVQLPQPISWWPLAPGWYLVFAFVILCLVGLALLYRRKLARQRRRQRIIEQFDKLQAQGNVAKAMAYIKQVAINVYPARELETLQGQAWVDFLQSTARSVTLSSHIQQQLGHVAYQATPENPEAIFVALKSWLEQQSC